MYSACYAPAKEIMQECYNEVRSGNEIRSVVMQGARLNDINTGKIDGTFTWKVRGNSWTDGLRPERMCFLVFPFSLVIPSFFPLVALIFALAYLNLLVLVYTSSRL